MREAGFPIAELIQDQLKWASTGFGPLIKEDTNRIDTTWNMLTEEMLELSRATTEVEVLDAVTDIFVVVAQLWGTYREDEGDIDLKYVSTLNRLDIPSYLRKTQSVLNMSSGKERAVSALGYWAKLADTLQEENRFPIQEAITEVTASNWSKFPTIGNLREKYGEELSDQELLASECKWIEENRKECASVVGNIVDEGVDLDAHVATKAREDSRRVSFRKDGGKGKIVKPSTYFEPNLKQYLDNRGSTD